MVSTVPTASSPAPFVIREGVAVDSVVGVPLATVAPREPLNLLPFTEALSRGVAPDGRLPPDPALLPELVGSLKVQRLLRPQGRLLESLHGFPTLFRPRLFHHSAKVFREFGQEQLV